MESLMASDMLVIHSSHLYRHSSAREIPPAPAEGVSGSEAANAFGVCNIRRVVCKDLKAVFIRST